MAEMVPSASPTIRYAVELLYLGGDHFRWVGPIEAKDESHAIKKALELRVKHRMADSIRVYRQCWP